MHAQENVTADDRRWTEGVSLPKMLTAAQDRKGIGEPKVTILKVGQTL